LAHFYETGWLPGCLISQALHEREGFCKTCSKGMVVSGAAFFTYLETNAQTLRPHDDEKHCCSHANHVWVPVRDLLEFMKVPVAQFERLFLNTHQCFDATSKDLLQHL
jgi:hypothetical protein